MEKEKMYYATFKDIGQSDVAAFKTEKERDDWVNFQDPLSLILKSDKDNCTFQRMAVTEDEVSDILNSPTTLHIIDECNDRQEWFIRGE